MRVVMSRNLTSMRMTSPSQGIASDGTSRCGCCRGRLASAAQVAQHVRQYGEGGPRGAVGRDERGVPAVVAPVPVEDVDALDPRAQADKLGEDVVDRLGGVGQRLTRVLD